MANVLYQEFRPHTFEETKGQNHVIQTIKNQYLSGKIAHAYMFTGSRGTGKTTTARNIARLMNCENPTNGEPCNQCSACQEILNNTSTDVIEIDAASNRGIDDIRNLKDSINHVPLRKRKIYIIDEVHMLTNEAFNALLKPIEEPPAHVIFILATTEPHKVPVTILSRCQRFDFRRIEDAVIIQRLTEIVKIKNIKIDDAAIQLIAKEADGGMRDALSILGQLWTSVEENISVEHIHQMFGTVKSEVYSNLGSAMYTNNLGDALKIVAGLYKEGKDVRVFIKNFNIYLRDMLIKAYNPAVFSMAKIFSHAENEMRYAAQPQIVFELAVIEAAQKPKVSQELQDALQRIEALEKQVELGKKVG